MLDLFSRIPLKFIRSKDKKNSQEQSDHSPSAESANLYQAGRDQYNGCTVNNTTYIIKSETNQPSTENVDAIGSLHNQLVNKYFDEKIIGCRNDIFQTNFSDLKAKLEEIKTNEGLLPKEDKEAFDFYAYLLAVAIDDNEKIDIYKPQVSERYLSQVEAIDHCELSKDICFNDYRGLYAETKVIIINLLFGFQNFDRIIEFYNESTASLTPSVFSNIKPFDSLKYLAGLSYFNKHEYHKACHMLAELSDRNYAPRYDAFFLMADIYRNIEQIMLGTFKDTSESCANTIKDDVRKLEIIRDKNPRIFDGNDTLIAATKIQIILATDKTNEDELLRVYNGLSEGLKNNPVILNLVAQFYSNNEEYQKAINIYQKIDWKHSENIGELYLYVLLLAGRYEDVVNSYNSIDEAIRNNNVRDTSFMLSALQHIDYVRFKDQLKKQLVKTMSDGDYDDFIVSLFCVEDEQTYADIVVPFIEQNFDGFLNYSNRKSSISPEKTDIERNKEILLTLCIQFNQFNLALRISERITNLKQISIYSLEEIYRSLFFKLRSIENIPERNQNVAHDDDLHLIEDIVDEFIIDDAYLKYFYQLKTMCCQQLGKEVSAEYYSKELFKIAPDQDLAANIIQFLYSRGEQKAEQYEVYISCLKSSTKPHHMMALAFAYRILGRTDDAEYSAYKAIYYLNGSDDYSIYGSYFALYTQLFTYDHKTYSSPDRVTGGTVVVLRTIGKDNNGDYVYDSSNYNIYKNKAGRVEQILKSPEDVIYCLDQESELDIDDNSSANMIHLNKTGKNKLLYNKLLGGRIGTVYNLNGVHYKIFAIGDRYAHTFRFVRDIVLSHQDQFGNVIFTITADSPEESLEKLKQFLIDHKHNSLLDTYHFLDNEYGIPIETLRGGDYNGYIGCVAYLAGRKNEVLYTGLLSHDIHGGKYIVSLATLVLLALTNSFYVLDEFKKAMNAANAAITFAVPSSLGDFVDERINKCGTSKINSEFSVEAGEDDQLYKIPNQSDNEIEIWRKIKKYCQDFEFIPVSDEERMGLKIIKDVSAEEFINAMKCGSIELDYLVAANKAKSEAVYICDDLFFRKMASYMGIKNINCGSLAYDIYEANPEKAKNFVEMLSKLNYLCAPWIPSDDHDWNNKIITNLTTGVTHRIQRAIDGVLF